jgi:hypothetical protein
MNAESIQSGARTEQKYVSVTEAFGFDLSSVRRLSIERTFVLWVREGDDRANDRRLNSFGQAEITSFG